MNKIKAFFKNDRAVDWFLTIMTILVLCASFIVTASYIVKQEGHIEELSAKIDILTDMVEEQSKKDLIDEDALSEKLGAEVLMRLEAEEAKKEEESKNEEKEESKKPTSTSSKPSESSTGTFSATITHYCACSKCNGKYSQSKDGINYTATASGITLSDGMAGNYCAATFGKLGDIVTINGVDYEIVDRMGGNSGKRVDIFVAAGHERCKELGRFTTEVTLK